MPKLWDSTIEAHRREVDRAILDAAVALVSERGLLSVTMSQIAETAGIGRATLYKYFPDVQTILRTWHDRQIAGHLRHLIEIRDRAGDAADRIGGVLTAYAAHSTRGHHDPDLVALLHRHDHVGQAQQQLHELLRELLSDGAQAGAVRDDVAPEELASYCLHALDAAHQLQNPDALRRLVTVTLAGLRPDAAPPA